MYLNPLGIDVSKKKLDVCLLRPEGPKVSKVFENGALGFEALRDWIGEQGVGTAHVCMEFTGGYELSAAEFLSKEGHVVSIVAPTRIVNFARSLMRRNKTDKLDAFLIAQYCKERRPERWKPQSDELRGLRDLSRRRQELIKIRTAERNRLRSPGNSEYVRRSQETVLAMLAAQIEDIEREIRRHIDSHEDLKRLIDLLCSVKGIKLTSAARILGEIGDITRFRCARDLAVYVGLAPCVRLSGNRTHGAGRLPFWANKELKSALRMCATVAKRFDPSFAAFAGRLEGRHLAPKQITAAVMRKLLHVAYGILKSGKPFDRSLAFGS